ncbi:NAD(P)H-hydrate dehydratase [Croceivirga sp. JEA036]|uniref:NAD(P)H-hydrate dehydratase n=1 Tax=Croceivirga sp. JEA036 TaxID=2721162 RepID=UPI001439D2B1|nr:NAD(P)H-hydrate dehydratase [Croceivirga sp. JEA036]NJB35148.1 NAD(P)H-hydrate dehydratase [Croceivirga sp. JEA036]
MKILSAQQVHDADDYTIKKYGISSDILMERAADQLFNWLHSRLQGGPVKLHLFCGIGNNGGDGLALARMLKEHGYNMEVYVVKYSEKRSKDFLINLDRLKDRKLWPEFIDETLHLPEIGKDNIVIDAIFGIGLNRDPEDWVLQVIQHINNANAFTLAVDIPSGLFMDRLPTKPENVVQADFVLSFQTPKLPFFLPQTAQHLNHWELLDIGLEPEYIYNLPTAYEYIGKPEIAPLYQPRLKFSHKGNYGHVAVVGGSYGKIGAIQLASKGALQAGAGLVTAYVPKCGYIPLQTAIPEVMVMTDTKEDCISEIKVPEKVNVVCIGMGMGHDQGTQKALLSFLKTNKLPLVLDADAINLLAKQEDFLGLIPEGSVFTPHPKEFERLVGPWKDDFDKVEKGKLFSKKYNCILVLKGAHTITFANGVGFVNSTGNPGMATGGCGDVLAGMIAGLLAQGYSSLKAAIMGVYLHGLAADVGVNASGFEAFTASQLVDNIGNAFLELFKREQSATQEADKTE